MKEKENFEELLSEEASTVEAAPQVGDKVEGTIVSLTSEHAFVDCGGKAEGRMDTAALTDPEGNLTVAVGDRIEAAVSGIDDESGALILGQSQGHQLHGMAEIERAYQNKQTIEGMITGVIKGGVEVQIAGQRAFCPASHIDLRYVEDLSVFVGERHPFRITRYEGGKRRNVVVSRRVLLEEEQRVLAEETRNKLEVGAILKGRVSTIKDYGAFVDIGGMEGMVHISELALRRVNHPSDVISTGEEVEVQVLRIEKSDNPKQREKIALSMKALAKDPWRDAADRYTAGSLVNGKITRLQPFGAFVELEPGLEGLIHISELGAGRRIAHPQEVVSPGQEVEASVLGVDAKKRRISLSLDANRKDEPPPRETHAPRKEPARAAESNEDDEGKIGTLGDLLLESMKKNR